MPRAAVVLLALSFSSFCAAPAAAQPAADALARAEREVARGHRTRAWAILARAAERAPSDVGLATALARLLPAASALPAGRADPGVASRAASARDALRRALAAADETSPPAPAEAYRALAWATALAGDLDAAVDDAEARVGLQDRESAELLRDLATIAAGRDMLRLARRALEAALRAYPQDNSTLTDLGVVELALGEADAAAERFARILGRVPTDIDARRDLAGALVAAGRADSALALLARAAEHHPEDPELRLELAFAALEAREPAQAETAARDAIARLPTSDARAHAALGAALAALERPDDAREAFREALRRDPRDVRARQGLSALDAPPAEPAPRGIGARLAAP
ncbi:MAG: tetratricopeptide repeat protein [Sandaracinaceae bacterium]